MAKPPYPEFLHAFRSDGSVYSICRRCQGTVASKSNEIDLRKPEEAHVCADLNLHRLFYADEKDGTTE